MIHKAYWRWLAEFRGTVSPWRMWGFGRWTEEKLLFRTEYRVKSGTRRHSKWREKVGENGEKTRRQETGETDKQTEWVRRAGFRRHPRETQSNLGWSCIQGPVRSYSGAGGTVWPTCDLRSVNKGWNGEVCKQVVTQIGRWEWKMSLVLINMHKQGCCPAFYLIWPKVQLWAQHIAQCTQIILIPLAVRNRNLRNSNTVCALMSRRNTQNCSSVQLFCVRFSALMCVY